MPNRNPLLEGLQQATSIGPMPGQDRREWFDRHPILRELGQLLTGGALDPRLSDEAGPADLLMAMAPAGGRTAKALEARMSKYALRKAAEEGLTEPGRALISQLKQWELEQSMQPPEALMEAVNRSMPQRRVTSRLLPPDTGYPEHLLNTLEEAGLELPPPNEMFVRPRNVREAGLAQAGYPGTWEKSPVNQERYYNQARSYGHALSTPDSSAKYVPSNVGGTKWSQTRWSKRPEPTRISSIEELGDVAPAGVGAGPSERKLTIKEQRAQTAYKYGLRPPKSK